jgi:hypothetical protein
MSITHYVSPSGIEVYQFEDSDTIHISGNPPSKYTGIEFESAYDFEEYVKDKIDDGVGFDSEYSQFFAYTKTKERAIEFVKNIENWFDKIRK